MKVKTLFFLFFLVSTSVSLFGQEAEPLTALLKKLETFTTKYSQEKIHLHLDKPYYAIGDNIWFKAYVTDSKTSLPTTISNILYVELINDSDSLKAQLKLPMQSGISWGDFKLSDSLQEGNYRIRAYTQWMRNAGPAFFFDKTIKIGNGWTNKVLTTSAFTYSADNKQEYVNTNIRFTSISDNPFANAEVNYQIVLGNKKTSTTKAVTDAKGEININIANALNNTAKSGKIIATITLPDGQKAVKEILITSTSGNVDVQFFPEGGNLIEGLPGKVAVKAVNANGLGEQVSGAITDNDGVEVLTFETTNLGMGTFSLNPMPGKTYIAKIKFKNGAEKNVALPKTQMSGYMLTVNNLDSSKMSIKVMLTADLLNKGELNLLAQHNGKILFAGKVPTSKQIVSVVVPKTTFPSGIVQITLFDPQNRPVSERLTFVNNTKDKINLDLQNLKPVYLKKGPVDLAVTATNNSKPLQGSFSVSVTNTAMVDPDLENESNILTSLLLTADLKGYVEKPNRYFLKNDIETKIELDQLLLTQGWRKIDWVAVNSDQLPVSSFPAEKGMKISGAVLNDGKPITKAKVSLMSLSKGIFATETETDANGKFIFDKIAFTDSTTFALKAIASNGHKGVKIVLDQVPPQMVTANKNLADIEINVNQAIKNYVRESVAYFNDQESKGFLTRSNRLKEVEIVAKANKAAPASANLNGPGKADAVFNAKDFEDYPSLSQYLNGRVLGVKFADGIPYSTRNRGPMAVYIDGVRWLDVPKDSIRGELTTGSIDNIPLIDIESVEILRTIVNTSIYGQDGINGVMIITTKTGKGQTNSYRKSPGMLAYAPKGFYQVRQFYSPKYDVSQDNKPDYRPTVMWEPNLVSDVDGKANLKYYNTDQPGTYRVVIEGIDADGNLARKVVNYTVN